MGARSEAITIAAPIPVMPDRRARIARTMLAATITAELLGLLVYWRAWSSHVPIGYGADLPALLSADLFSLAAGIVGLIILTSRPGNLIGRLLAITALGGALIVLAMYAAAAGMARGAEPWSTFLGWLGGSLLQPGAAGLLALIMVVFPTGRLVSPRWRWAVLVTVIGAGLRFVETAFGQGPVYYFPTISNPFAPGGVMGDVVTLSREYSIGLWLLFVGFVLGAGSLFVRYRGADRDERHQIRWFVLAGGAAILAAVPLMYAFLFIDPALGVGEGFWVGYFVVSTVHPIAVGIAITRYRLYEIDRIVNRAVLYGSLTAILAGVFTAGIGLAQRLFVAVTNETSDAAAVAATLVVATLYAPLRKRLEAIVDRRFKFEQGLFGPYRDEVSRVMSVTDPERAAERLIREAVGELGVVGGAVLGPRDKAVATAGAWPVEAAVRIQVRGGRGALRTLVLGPRRDGQAVDPAALAALEEVAGLVAAAAWHRAPA